MDDSDSDSDSKSSSLKDYLPSYLIQKLKESKKKNIESIRMISYTATKDGEFTTSYNLIYLRYHLFLMHWLISLFLSIGYNPNISPIVETVDLTLDEENDISSVGTMPSTSSLSQASTKYQSKDSVKKSTFCVTNDNESVIYMQCTEYEA